MIVALVPAFNEEHYVASVLVRLSGVVDGVWCVTMGPWISRGA